MDESITKKNPHYFVPLTYASQNFRWEDTPSSSGTQGRKLRSRQAGVASVAKSLFPICYFYVSSEDDGVGFSNKPFHRRGRATVCALCNIPIHSHIPTLAFIPFPFLIKQHRSHTFSFSEIRSHLEKKI